MGDWPLILAILAMLAAIAAPLLLIFALFRVANRRWSGRRGKHDRLFEGMARASTMTSHLGASTPHPDDLAVPLPDLAVPERTLRRWRARRARQRVTFDDAD
jgi:hypothetical protein